MKNVICSIKKLLWGFSLTRFDSARNIYKNPTNEIIQTKIPKSELKNNILFLGSFHSRNEIEDEEEDLENDNWPIERFLWGFSLSRFDFAGHIYKHTTNEIIQSKIPKSELKNNIVFWVLLMRKLFDQCNFEKYI